MKMSEIKEMTAAELQTKEAELSQELFNLRFQKSISQLHDTARLGKVKRDRARILTRIKELEKAV